MSDVPRQPEKVPGTELRQLADGAWQYRIRWKDPVTGRRLVETCDTVQDARDFKAHLRLLRRRGDLSELDRGREILDDFAARWLTDWAAINLARRTLVAYTGTYDLHLKARVGHLQLRQFNPAVIDQLRRDLEKDGAGAPTVRKALAVLQSMFAQAVIWGETTSNPVKDVKKPPARRSKIITPLTVDQVEQILEHLGKHAGAAHRMLAELLAYGAGRPQDVLALPWTHVGTQRLVYAYKNVDGQIVDGAKTGAEKARSVEMLDTLRKDLAAYRLQQPHGATLVIARPDGQAWRAHDYKNWCTKRPRGAKRPDGTRVGKLGPFTEAANAAGVPGITPYFLRHSYAALRLAEQRLSLQEIAEEMGHSVEVLARIYSHVISDYRGRGPIKPDELIQAARQRIGQPRRPSNAPHRKGSTG